MEITNQKGVEFNKRLRAYLSNRLPQSADVDDLTQDILVKILENIDKLNDSTKIIPWMYKIAGNTVTDFYRRKKLEYEPDEILDFLATNESKKKASTKMAEFSHCVQPLIDTLPEKYSEAIRTVELDGIAQKQFAEDLNLSYSNAKSRVQRARELFKKSVTGCCELQLDKYGNILDYKPEKSCGCS